MVGRRGNGTDSLASREVLSLVVDALEVVLRRSRIGSVMPAGVFEPVLHNPKGTLTT